MKRVVGDRQLLVVIKLQFSIILLRPLLEPSMGQSVSTQYRACVCVLCICSCFIENKQCFCFCHHSQWNNQEQPSATPMHPCERRAVCSHVKLFFLVVLSQHRFVQLDQHQAPQHAP